MTRNYIFFDMDKIVGLPFVMIRAKLWLKFVRFDVGNSFRTKSKNYKIRFFKITTFSEKQPLFCKKVTYYFKSVQT